MSKTTRYLICSDPGPYCENASCIHVKPHIGRHDCYLRCTMPCKFEASKEWVKRWEGSICMPCYVVHGILKLSEESTQ